MQDGSVARVTWRWAAVLVVTEAVLVVMEAVTLGRNT